MGRFTWNGGHTSREHDETTDTRREHDETTDTRREHDETMDTRREHGTGGDTRRGVTLPRAGYESTASASDWIGCGGSASAP
jgi:hypothetical protein